MASPKRSGRKLDEEVVIMVLEFGRCDREALTWAAQRRQQQMCQIVYKMVSNSKSFTTRR